VLAVIATMKIKPGMEKEFEAIAKELGCKLYTVCRGEAPRSYVFMERYVDQAAGDHHRSTDYFKELGRRIGHFIEGRPDIQRMTEI
jgi:quinol monooxygenase YgiN